MNKRILLCVASITLLSTALIFSIYQYKHSYSAPLNAHGFKKEDIIVNQGYALDPNAEHITKVVLLRNIESLAIAGFEKSELGLWRDYSIKSSMESPSNGQYAIYPLNIMRKSSEGYESEKHLFVATYIDSSNVPLIIGNSNFYLSVDYFTIDNKTILFAHAIAARNKDQFTSDEVITYINSHLKK
ncbi:hypothetical protein NQ117_15335 [Paenibacillus sp. SC116]|uniref:hypothetical protein n=1 Tax=Paenibacillus sp. SC116 TaxID=2968986 RepID=UPI00215B1100|nr:hypothetical protein [Paenibacillus sp. SC116]MCR8845055.1 hypothetical protein [Paenibacillus sp. SC116]